MRAALSIKGISYSFGTKAALDDVSLHVERGRICGLLGLNGAGKTTLFSLITRLYDNTGGSIEVLGHDVRQNPREALRQMGVVFQARTLDTELTVHQNLVYHAALYGMPRLLARERIATELARAGLSGHEHEKIRSLSGGEARRIEIVRALLHKPSLLLLDEPTVGLDIGAREKIINHVRSLAKSDGIAVLWATHLFDEIDREDQVAILHKGKVLALGDHDAILETANAANLAEAFRKLADQDNQPEAGSETR